MRIATLSSKIRRRTACLWRGAEIDFEISPTGIELWQRWQRARYWLSWPALIEYAAREEARRERAEKWGSKGSSKPCSST